ncbi:PHB depolymerase family esterase [Duganella sp. HH105]|uniref:alpha/beta hydrolase family esterase n=1 Tax=Duganella sp. HH105 TaxID=1781067 RepID=UPI000877E2F3|nr:PHB depolymerase family esterase [Duganella sp. HH105]OEZ62650.1 esterase PHB depolymerase [Duganella sp. HH105]
MMTVTRYLPLIAAMTVLQAGAATIVDETVQRPEGARHYLLAQPATPVSGKLPLVILLHGHAASANLTFGKGKIDDPAAAWLAVADREGLLVIAPDGAKGSDDKQGWNDCRADAPTNPKTDDVGFIAAMIDQAVAQHNADPSRVYLSGASNGGGMVYRAAIEMGPRLAAVAVSSMLMPSKNLCAAPKRALPVLVAHGTEDKIAPYAGGEVGHFLLTGRGSGLSAEDSVKYWRELAQLPSTPTITKLPHRDASDKTALVRYVWGSDPKGTQVEFLKMENAGHVQPSMTHKLSWLVQAVLGKQNGDVEFADETWAFFKDKRATP